MTDYQSCPSGSIFPLVFGLNGGVGDFQPTYGSTQFLSTDISYDGEYYLLGGSMAWDGTEFLPQENYETVWCEGANCSNMPDSPDTNNRWQRGIIHLYHT